VALAVGLVSASAQLPSAFERRPTQTAKLDAPQPFRGACRNLPHSLAANGVELQANLTLSSVAAERTVRRLHHSAKLYV
jgi:hypothetical protein